MEIRNSQVSRIDVSMKKIYLLSSRKNKQFAIMNLDVGNKSLLIYFIMKDECVSLARLCYMHFSMVSAPALF